MLHSSMVDLSRSCCPTISYRPIRTSDLEVLEKIHGDLFPIRSDDLIICKLCDFSRYEPEFFHNVVNGHGIVSWGAVDRSRPNGQSDELIGFVTVRIVLAKESEIEDLLRLDMSRADQTLVYILTLGVVDSYRNFGIGEGELVTLLVTCARSGFKSMAARLWKNDGRKVSKWLRCKEPGGLLPTTQNKSPHN
ncbi:hypothetical protein RJ639_008733 [Escallonia herrerae]|uniref:histone acetyltransferase n=1 Tax=Escallonia herrerae TaxID=1293975 RepID=A0AA88VPN9_9ASTE|nr:hypothetical protein RJ639_008733 [Escallonia herrerae]